MTMHNIKFLQDEASARKSRLFSFEKWGATVFSDADACSKYLNSLNLIGSKIIGISIIGKCTEFERSAIVDRAYDWQRSMEGKVPMNKPAFLDIDLHAPFARQLEIEEPVEISFSGGKTLEIYIAG